MFNRLLMVRLKAAENALKAGRIDEAFRMATEPDLRANRRGAAVLAKLSLKFIERSKEHFKADRYAEALLDLTKADADGSRTSEVAELREQVQIVAEEEMRKANSRRLRLEAARRRINRGSLAGGQRLLEEVSARDLDAQVLRQSAEDKQIEAENKLDQVEQLIKSGQLRAAIGRFNRAKALSPHIVRVAQIEAKLSAEVLRLVRVSLEAGSIARAGEDLRSLGDIAKNSIQRRELAEILSQAEQAVKSMQTQDYDRLLHQIIRLGNLMPKAGWVQKNAKQVRQLDDLLLALRTGPLGRQLTPEAGLGDEIPTDPGSPRSLDETVALQPQCGSGGLPEQLLMLVDGGGSYLIHRGIRLSIGRAAASKPADLAVFSDISERHADIARLEDDYFLYAARDVEVGGRPVRQQLLRTGDQIVLARRAKFAFWLPNRKSNSAVLDLSDSTKAPCDVRRVVLFRQTAMVGHGSNTHVTCPTAERSLLLFERAGRLWIRPDSVRGVQSEARPIVLGESMELCGVSFVIRPWEARIPGQRMI